ncbi:ribonuclease H-like domain, reverse transcriptase, RNA-dependent DNA polymerase [Tanacetum coccineum]|uniref:Ribonuclease H-like domain, reverse transcriptase, RNA-dependent DNA polymerase n=1 Tax=Tanacetum coccineum TaxID=301880 RepID=A0ABQ5GUG2_9ASTR
MQEVILFYKGLDVPTREILDSKCVISSMKVVDAKKAIQEMADYSQKWHNGTSTRCRSTKTYDGLAAIQAQLNNLGREIKKVNEKVGQYQAAAPGFYQRNNGNPSYQERRQTIKESLSKFMAESAKRHEENSNLIKEIRASTDAQGVSIKALEIQIGQMSKVLQERGSGNLPSSTKTNLRDHVNQANIPFPSFLCDDCYDKEEGSCGLKNFDGYSIGTTLLNNSLPPKKKDPRSFTLSCYINNLCLNKALADLGSSMSVMPFSTYTNLALGELAPTKLIVELADRTMKRPKGIAENVLVGIDKFVFPVDFIALDMPEDITTSLILGRPFLSTSHAKIDVFKRKITLKVGNDKVMVRKNQVDDFGPTIKDGEIIDEPIGDIVETTHDNKIIDGLHEYLSYCYFDRKIHIKCAFNLHFSCMIDYEHVNANFFPLLSINVISKSFYNSKIKEKVEYKGKTVVGAFMNIPIFVGNFFVVVDFAVMENMDAYRDEGICDIIVGRPFCREACVKARRFDGMTTIYNETIVSAQDESKGISHPYQKLKGFYKGALNLGPEYMKNENLKNGSHVDM